MEFQPIAFNVAVFIKYGARRGLSGSAMFSRPQSISKCSSQPSRSMAWPVKIGILPFRNLESGSFGCSIFKTIGAGAATGTAGDGRTKVLPIAADESIKPVVGGGT